MAPHDRSQADRVPLPALGHVLLLPGRALRGPGSARAPHPGRRPDHPRHLQPLLHPARGVDDLLLPDPGDPVGARQLPGSDHDRGARSGLPPAEPGQLVRLQRGGAPHPGHGHQRRRRHRVDVLRPVLLHLLQHLRHPGGGGDLRHRLLFDLHRPQLHRDDPPDEGARNGLVPAPPLHLVALRHQPHHRARYAGGRRHHPSAGRRAAVSGRDLQPPPRRRPGPLPAPLLVLLPPGGLHHDPPGDGSHQRADRCVRPPACLRLQVRRLRQHRHRGPGLSGLGPPHVRRRSVGVRGSGLLGPDHAGRGPLGGEGLQLDRHPLSGRRLLGHPDALRPRLHRPVHHRRADRG